MPDHRLGALPEHVRQALALAQGQPGIDPGTEFPVGPPTTLEPGDLVLLFTDGIVEAASPDGAPFGLERTLGIVRAHQQETPDAILGALFQAIGDFSGNQLHDDMTAVIIKAEGIARPLRPRSGPTCRD
jgi:hypothetical protein